MKILSTICAVGAAAIAIALVGTTSAEAQCRGPCYGAPNRAYQPSVRYRPAPRIRAVPAYPPRIIRARPVPHYSYRPAPRVYLAPRPASYSVRVGAQQLCIPAWKWQEIVSRQNPNDRCWYASTSNGQRSPNFFARCGTFAGAPGEVYGYRASPDEKVSVRF